MLLIFAYIMIIKTEMLIINIKCKNCSAIKLMNCSMFDRVVKSIASKWILSKIHTSVQYWKESMANKIPSGDYLQRHTLVLN